VGAIQLSIMLGGAFGGFLLDHISVGATFLGGAILLVLATLTVGRRDRIRPIEEEASANAPTRVWQTCADSTVCLSESGN
jgi:hypothetical protein